MKAAIAVVGVALLGVLVWWLLARDKPAPADAASAGSAAGSAGASVPSAPPAGSRATPVDRVGRVSPEERKRLAERIADARKRRAAAPGGGTSASPSGPPQLADQAAADATLVRTTMKDAIKEIIPILAECYAQGGATLPPQIEVVAKMTLTGDPDVGTIIDTDGLADKSGAPLDAAFDLCLKDALVTIQMPPLSEGGEVKVTYPFLFANAPDQPGSSGNLPP